MSAAATVSTRGRHASRGEYCLAPRAPPPPPPAPSLSLSARARATHTHTDTPRCCAPHIHTTRAPRAVSARPPLLLPTSAAPLSPHFFRATEHTHTHAPTQRAVEQPPLCRNRDGLQTRGFDSRLRLKNARGAPGRIAHTPPGSCASESRGARERDSIPRAIRPGGPLAYAKRAGLVERENARAALARPDLIGTRSEAAAVRRSESWRAAGATADGGDDGGGGGGGAALVAPPPRGARARAAAGDSLRRTVANEPARAIRRFAARAVQERFDGRRRVTRHAPRATRHRGRPRPRLGARGPARARAHPASSRATRCRRTSRRQVEQLERVAQRALAVAAAARRPRRPQPRARPARRGRAPGPRASRRPPTPWARRTVSLRRRRRATRESARA